MNCPFCNKELLVMKINGLRLECPNRNYFVLMHENRVNYHVYFESDKLDILYFIKDNLIEVYERYPACKSTKIHNMSYDDYIKYCNKINDLKAFL